MLFRSKGKKIRWTDKALANFKHRIKELTGRSWGVSSMRNSSPASLLFDPKQDAAFPQKSYAFSEP